MLAANSVLQNRYRIIRQLGQGGMGTVYEAIDERFDHQVAIKETHFTQEALRKQFEREARLLYKLRHPAIARVIDHFTENEGQYLVMDYIEGEDLWERLQAGGAFPVEEVLRWGDQLLDALNYLHSQDPPIIHRDIKPQNLKVTNTGQIILLDFGLAKGFAGQLSRVTTSGSIFGYTPNYAPLEQIQGTGTGPYSDLYSLAATLYHLMTGVVPPDVLSRLAATTDGQPDPLRSAHEVNKEIPRPVATVLSRSMSIGRTQRFQSAREMRQSLINASQEIAPSSSELRATMLPHTVAGPAVPKQEIRARENPPESTLVAQQLHAQVKDTTAPASETFPSLQPPATQESPSTILKSPKQSEKEFKRTKILIGIGFATIFLFVWGYNLLTNKNMFGTATTNASSPTATAPTSTPQSNSRGSAFTLKLRACGEAVWTLSKVDGGNGVEYVLTANESREFKPTERVSIFLSRSKLSALEVSINNRPATVTPESRGGLVEIVITKDNFAQLMK